MKKQIINIILSAFLLVAMLPITIMPTSAEDEVKLPEATAKVFEQDKNAPAGFESAKDPHGIAQSGDIKVIAHQNEIMLTTYSGGRGSENYQTTYQTFDTYNQRPDRQDPNFDLTSGRFNHVGEKKSIDMGDIYYAQSVAFDSDGDGTKEMVAYIGYEWRWSNIIVWTVDSRNNNITEKILVGKAAWVKNISYLDLNYFMLNFFSITAGDYNGDGIDTVMIYAVLDPDSNSLLRPILHELKLNGTRLERVNNQSLDAYMHSGYMNHHGLRSDTSAKNVLAADLTTGDFNNDGYDDMAFVSYLNDYDEKYADRETVEFMTPRLVINYGSSAGIKSNPDSSCSVTTKNYVNNQDESLNHFHGYPIAPSIDAGDIDGDGYDEIVVGGYYGNYFITDDGQGNRKPQRDQLLRSAAYMSVAAYDAHNSNQGLAKMFDQVYETNAWTQGGTTVNDDVTQPLAVKVADLDGPENPAHVFLNGSVYYMTNGKLNHDFTPAYFQYKDVNSNGLSVTVGFINSVISGVFDGNSNGHEQFVSSVGLKIASENDYAYLPSIIGKTVDKVDGQLVRNYYGSTVNSDNDQQIYYQKKDGNAFLTAVDNDNDALTVKYRSKEYAWSDPEVLAVLQAAPYFKELGGYDEFATGSTTYSVETGYESSDGKTHSHSLGVGFVGKVDAEVIEMELRLGYSGNWNSESFINKGSSTKYTISTGAKNTVIVKRTPTIEYAYDVYDYATNRWIENGHHKWVTRDTSYFLMSIDDYNAMVDYYNDIREQYKVSTNSDKEVIPLRKIDETNAAALVNNEGNPYAYTTSLQDTIMSSISLNHNGGSQTVTYLESVGKGETNEEMHGFTYESSFMGGGPAKIGAYSSTELQWGHNKTITKINGQETSGTVANIDSEVLSEKLNVPKSTLEAYSFNWAYGSYDIDLGGAGFVPVYGYKTSNVTSPSARVNDLSYSLSDDAKTLTLNWTEPNTDPNNPNKIDGYYVYYAKEGNEFTRVSDDLITDTKFVIDNFDRTKNYQFGVKTASKSVLPTGGYSYYEGVFSNIVSHNGDLSGKSSYEIAVENGFIGTEVEWLASLIGEQGEKGSGITSIQKTGSDGIYDTYTIYYSNGDFDTFTITNGQKGEDGKDGDAIELQVVDGVIEWKYDSETDDKWRELIGIEGNNITIQGLQGNDGLDGREIEINYNAATTMIEWRYVGETTWNDLMPISELKGEDARDIEFKIEEGKLMWRYVSEDIPWTFIGKYDALIGEYDSNKYIEFNAGNKMLKWRYLSSNDEFIDSGISKDGLPQFNKPIKLHISGDDIKWRYYDNSNKWSLLNISKEALANIDLTQIIEVNLDHDNLYIRYLNNKGDYQDIKKIEDITGYDETIVELRTRDDNLLEYSGRNIYKWQDIGLISDIKGEAGKDGREVKLQANEETGYIEWQYEGEETWHQLIAIASLKGEKGADGERGVGIANIKKTSTIDNIDTYTITYGDGSTSTFDVSNGLKGDKGDKGEQGDKGEKGDKGEQGERGQSGYQGYNGTDGVDGKDGLTPYIGENGHWFIGDKDTNVQAEAKSITEINVDEEGKFVFVMSDGSEMNAKNPDGSIVSINNANQNEQLPTRNLAYIAIVLSLISIAWNVVEILRKIVMRKRTQ